MSGSQRDVSGWPSVWGGFDKARNLRKAAEAATAAYEAKVNNGSDVRQTTQGHVDAALAYRDAVEAQGHAQRLGVGWQQKLAEEQAAASG